MPPSAPDSQQFYAHTTEDRSPWEPLALWQASQLLTSKPSIQLPDDIRDTIDTDSLKSVSRPRQQFLKKGAAGTQTSTEFNGLLKVTDASAFKLAATQGISTAKAFDFGLLCLSPL